MPKIAQLKLAKISNSKNNAQNYILLLAAIACHLRYKFGVVGIFRLPRRVSGAAR
jgi:hypothetical protein